MNVAGKVPGHLGEDALLPLWRALHERLSSGRAVRSVTVRGLDPASQEAVADLLGLSSYPGPVVRVRLDRVEEALAPSGADVRSVVEAVVGPIGDRAAHRERVAGERERLWSWLSRHPVVVAQPALSHWVDRVRADGVPGGGPEVFRVRLEHALRVVAALPAEDGRPLPALAAEVVGDPHALDGGRPLAHLVLKALAALRDLPVPGNAHDRRALWGAFGVDCDVHSSSVLTLGLRPEGDGPLAATLRVWADAGRAAVVTLDQLSMDRSSTDAHPSWSAPVVHVVENPSVLAVAQRGLGSACPPLVCTAGWPSGAAVALLRSLSRSGAELRYHGDFDGEGLRIAAHVMAGTGARPWRMGVGDYLAAAAGTAGAPHPGRVTAAPWDPGLADALSSRGVAVHEEQVAEVLVADLRAVSARGAGGAGRSR
ncbi:TIGR02679 family protein [Nocardiopsis lambiniae]|uniref:TIGR02679 family protein n=1 Tax=Nocardiopsis lambiniae TaxID=3075539 RepID=A0ABU2MDI9_9ACTN|nr:TIGR02679 family protein [Nocardiopsis sp. DSM 44743]MDT0329991.1 TIGR02679 family protein [Nocardiopsis sp. DSM 44743]